MKVANNSLSAVKDFFVKELVPYYEEREVRQMFRMCAAKFCNLSYNQTMVGSINATESELLKFFGVVKQLKKYVPIQYLMGESEFYGLRFEVDNSVLIPRPETEELVQWVLDEWKGKPNISLIDFCTGSGCIPIAISLNSDIECEGYELSETAIITANKNAKLLRANVKLEHADVFKQKASDLRKVNVVTANPPYVAEADKVKVPENVWHEPHMALFAPPEDALIFYRQIAALAKDMLLPDGAVYVEINYDLSKEVCQVFLDHGYATAFGRQDIHGKHRMVKAQL